MSTPAWISALPTGVVKTDLTADAVDGVLTYTEALQLLNDVQTAGAVTASEFSSLQTAAANLNNGLAASDYVASIFTQLVDGSPANANWTAGGPAASASPLGDLAAGSTQTHLAQLVGQWFLGTNLPDPAPPSGPTYSYSTVTAPLYGPTGAAAVNDICQGADGDCEVMTSLILLVDNHPQQLAQMIVANPNGTWGVRFYVNGNEVWETVNDQFPTQGGELVYAHDPNFANTALWTAVIEKAYAQLSATGEIGHPAGVDSFDNINANAAADVMPAMIDASSVTYFNASDPSYTADKILYIDAVASGDDVMVETGADAKDTFDASGNMELIGDHAFAVTGYDAATGDFIVRNPWGNSFTGQNWDTTFEASLSAIAGVQGDFAIDDTGHGGSTMTLISESPQLLANAASAIAGFVKVIDSTGAAPTLYNLQVVGGGALQLNGAANVATSAEKALGQVVVSASDLAKVTVSAASGSPILLVSAYDGKAWSAFANVQLAVSSVGAIQNPVLDTVVAAAGSIAVTSLFKVGGTVNAANAFYEIVVPTGDGVVNLNGATNDFGAQQPGQTIYDVSGSQLSLLTYTAPASGGSVTLQGTVYTGSAWTPFQNIQVNVGVSVATALRDYANGQLESAATIADTAANIFANLGALQGAFTAGELSSILVTNTTAQHELLTVEQAAADKGALSILQGDVTFGAAPHDDFLNGGKSDYLIENSSGTVQVGQVGSGGQVAYSSFVSLGAWTFVGAGDYLGLGADQLLIQSDGGAIYTVQVVPGGTSTFHSFASASGWHVVGTGDYLGLGHDQFLIEDAAGAVEIGQLGSNEEATLTHLTSLGTWKIVGTGDFLGLGHDEFLMQSTTGALYTGTASAGSVTYHSFAQLPSGYQVVATGDFLDLGHDQFLIQNASGVVEIGQLGSGGEATLKSFTGLGAGWTFEGAGDYLGEGHDQFLIEYSNGVVKLGDFTGGAVHITQIGDVAAGWTIHG